MGAHLQSCSRGTGKLRNGTLVDLPCHVESHILPPESTSQVRAPFHVFCSQALYKSADVQQMLIAHREEEVPDAERPSILVLLLKPRGSWSAPFGGAPASPPPRRWWWSAASAARGHPDGLRLRPLRALEVPPADSIFAAKLVREASTARLMRS